MRTPTGRFPRTPLTLAAALGAAVLGAAAAVLPAVAGSAETTPVVQAEGEGFYTSFRWNPSQAEVAPGGAVRFADSTSIEHGIVWSGGPAKPTCESSVPVERAAANWSGSCTFAQAGTYTYYCSVHGPSMSGTIVVGSTGTTTTTTTTTPTATTPGTTTAPGPPPPPSGSGGEPPLAAVKVPHTQRGHAVRGSLRVTPAGAGDALRIEVLAARASLAKSHQVGQTRVGRTTRSSLHAGSLSFAVPLTRSARRALARHRRLALTVRIALAPFYGTPTVAKRAVVMRG